MNNFDLVYNQDLIKKIGKKISVLRKAKKMTRKELAFKIGISESQLFKYETGQSNIRIDKLIFIALVLEVRVSSFLLV